MLSSRRKVAGSIPGSSQLHVKASLSKILNSEPPDEQLAPSVYECLCEHVNVASVVYQTCLITFALYDRSPPVSSAGELLQSTRLPTIDCSQSHTAG